MISGKHPAPSIETLNAMLEESKGCMRELIQFRRKCATPKQEAKGISI
jgi:hypothetical protein